MANKGKGVRVPKALPSDSSIELHPDAEKLKTHEGQLNAVADIKRRAGMTPTRDEREGLALELRCLKYAAELTHQDETLKVMKQMAKDIRGVKAQQAKQQGGPKRVSDAPKLPRVSKRPSGTN